MLLNNFNLFIKKKWNSNSNSGSIFRNMIMLASGTAGANIISIGIMPIITRIYTPEDFGVLSIFITLSSILVPFSTFLYTMAIPLPKKDRTAFNILVFCTILTLLMPLMITLLCIILIFYISEYDNLQYLHDYWWLIPFFVTGGSLYEILSNWAIRKNAFRHLAGTKLWQATIAAVIKVFLGFLGLNTLGLLIGQIFSQAGGVLTLFKVFFQDFKTYWKHVSVDRIKFLLLHYADYPKYRLPSQFIMLINAKSPVLFWAWNFGPESTGQFSLSMMILLLPLTLISQSTSQAYYAEIAKIKNKNNELITLITKSITKKLFIISIIPFIIIFCCGSWIFEIFFGKDWILAGVYSSILSINLLTMFIINPIINVLNIINNQKYYLKINIMRFFWMLLVFLISYISDANDCITLGIYSFAMSFHRIYVYIKIMHIINSYSFSR
ncbi:Membrane protein involved in the export of O-antigen and teichoic acid [Desulfomicrobium apsheronum]|uniref:Membrane protein involved in the export of O-antigen and teichoic acid n=2 Tax=Desulfomicrobium apsheronum TaxID=52560 RepID=A0A1I3VWA6_9BACT|nr:Membrane protein involved in the export of O-antigen and teichoic acid [Desulfomicrobium apsheronum]